MMTNGLTIEVEGLSKTYRGGTRALDSLDLSVSGGQVYGLLGSNGAGKTTLFQILLGLLTPDCGKANILGRRFRYAPPALRQNVSFVSQEGGVYPSMSIQEHAEMLAGFYPTWKPSLLEHLVKTFELSPTALVGAMSGGEQRKAAIALTLATRVRVLLLDEPAANLDPVARRSLLTELADVLAEQEGTTVLFSTHILSDLERVADRIGVMDEGRLCLEKDLDDLFSRTRRAQIIFDTSEVPDGFNLPGQLDAGKREGSVFSCVCEVDDEEAFIAERMKEGLRANLFSVSLEDLFVDLIQSRRNAPAIATPSATTEKQSEPLEKATQ